MVRLNARPLRRGKRVAMPHSVVYDSRFAGPKRLGSTRSRPLVKVDARMSARPAPWYSELTRYHWFVLTVAALGWLFDTMDQQLFTLARVPAMKELLSHRLPA